MSTDEIIEFEKAVCVALGLDPKTVRGLNLRLRPCGNVSVTAFLLPNGSAEPPAHQPSETPEPSS